MSSIYLKTDGRAVPAAFKADVVLDMMSPATMSLNLHDIEKQTGALTHAGLDFLRFATANYCADKLVLRRSGHDRWTREILVGAPVTDVKSWRNAAPLFEEALRFLSQDDWKFEFRADDSKVEEGAADNFDAVCLFPADWTRLSALSISSNLTRTCASSWSAITTHLQPNHCRRIYPTAFSSIMAIVDYLLWCWRDRRIAPTRGSRCRPRKRCRRELGRSSSSPRVSPPPQLAARTFRYTFLRTASSRRTSLLAKIGSEVAVRAQRIPASSHHWLARCAPSASRTPFEIRTSTRRRGRCWTSARTSLLRAIEYDSASCAPDQRRYEASSELNCGYCYPCIIRRASFHAVNRDKASRYRHDVCRDIDLVRKPKPGADARSVLQSLSIEQGGLAVLRPGSLPDAIDVDALNEMYERGRDEFRALFRDKGTKAVRDYAGL